MKFRTYGVLAALVCLSVPGLALSQQHPPSFAQADKNSDGKISPTEFSGALTPTMQAFAAGLFKQFDRNNDGWLSPTEYQALSVGPSPQG